MPFFSSVVVIAVHLLEWARCNDEPSSEIFRKIYSTVSHGLITVSEATSLYTKEHDCLFYD